MNLPSTHDVAARIASAMARDRRRLIQGWRSILRRVRGGQPFDRNFSAWRRALEESCFQYQERAARLPGPSFPEDLPITAHVEEIRQAVASHQVVVVCGDTGSGKSTQLPKICLSMGRGVSGFIGHTQPRRIAARSVAARIAQELSSPLGRDVGFQVRFDQRFDPGGFIKVMTDGILLAQTQNDPLLEQYDTLIIDEAHERSLNIDFLLGCLRQILPRRRDLRLIVTSATIDPRKFSVFFNDAPVVSVEGRTFAVEVVHRPLSEATADQEEEDMVAAIVDVVAQRVEEPVSGAVEGPPSSARDILVFLPGEREIRAADQAIRDAKLRGVTTLPLYARLSAERQQQVFAAHPGVRVVLATNVAETSLTVPGIGYVIDTGLARLSRYNPKLKVQRLPIEKISQASANQRKGRCGRVAAGTCVRLYSDIDFDSRALFTPAEVLRTNLASVILQMKALRLGEPEKFPFIDPPSHRLLHDAYQTLGELQAIDARGELTGIGRRMARLPIDPRLARMVIAAREENSLREILIITASLATQDPRERPMDQRDAADAAHARYRHGESDFLALLRLWDDYHEARKTLSNAGLRRWCHDRFLSLVRLREWHDVHREIVETLPVIGITGSDINRVPAHYDAIHRALLTGLLSNVGMKVENNEYLAPRGPRLRIFPGSGLVKDPPKWIVAAELLETTRLYARTVARIKPTWVERLAKEQLQRDYLRPYWDDKVARVFGFEKAMLHGLLVQPGRRIEYGEVRPDQAREVFIHEGLVEGRYRCDASCLAHNRELESSIRKMSQRLRRTLLVDAVKRYEFYHRRLPAGIYTGEGFELWRRRAERGNPQLLFMSRADLMTDPQARTDPRDYPDTLRVAGSTLPVEYRWKPGEEDDGLTVTIPVAALGQLPSAWFDYLVPGLLPQRVEALLHSLPKSLRTSFIPASHYVAAAAGVIKPSDDPLPVALARALKHLTGVDVSSDAFNGSACEPYLRMRFVVVDEQGQTLGDGRDLAELQTRFAVRARAGLLAAAGEKFKRDGITKWDLGDLPERIELSCGPASFAAYPALIDQGLSVSLRLLARPDQAASHTRRGVRRLYLIELAEDCRQLVRSLPDWRPMSLLHAPLGSSEELLADLSAGAVDRAFLVEQPGGRVVRSHEEYEVRLRAGWPRLGEVVNQLGALVLAILQARQESAKLLEAQHSPAWRPVVEDIAAQLAALVYPGFVADTPIERLEHLPRYLRAVTVRLRKALDGGLTRDLRQLAQLEAFTTAWRKRRATTAQLGREPSESETVFRWRIEELRVALFAQELGTAEPVSVGRMERWMEELGG